MEKKKVSKRKPKFGPAHPWRICELGEHWVRPHPKVGTKGVRGFCRKNPSGKDQIYPEELQEIASKYFGDLKGPPCSGSLGFSQGAKFDSLIRGWTKYWNEVVQPKIPLDPDIVKGLIATESGFRATAKNRAGKKAGWARGLMQVTDESQVILGDEEGELKDFLVNVPQNLMSDPNLNIAAGIRWLFRKYGAAGSKLGRKATWDEAVAEYKFYLRQIRSGKSPRAMQDFRNFYNELKEKCSK